MSSQYLYTSMLLSELLLKSTKYSYEKKDNHNKMYTNWASLNTFRYEINLSLP